MRCMAAICILLSLMLSVCSQKAGAAELASSDFRKWSGRVIPLLREMRVNGTAKCRAAELALECRDTKPPQLRTACELLRQICLSDGESRAFTIRLLAAAGAKGYVDRKVTERLASLPNTDQAYHIEPGPRGDELIVVANTPTGLLYAARTLVQLIEVAARRGPASKVVIPLVTITDWPDIAERGQWGCDVTAHIAETAQYKLNVIEHPVKVSIDDRGEPTCSVSAEWIVSNLALGVKIVPLISHLEQISRYAGLTGRQDVISRPDPSKPLPSDYVPGLCMSSDATRGIIGGWLEKIAATDCVTDIMVWLSEERSPCFCEKCVGREPYELEVQAITAAFERAKRVNPNARLRLLTTQGSYNVNDRVIAAAPADFGISYYDGSRTYDSSRRPMIYPLLEEYARSGRWLGVYPQITHSWRTVFPWTAPQFIRFRAQEFAHKKLSNVIGYAVPSNHFHDFNVLALAEWTWNAYGRTPEEFARAYALKRGLKNPELFAEWAVLAGDAGWSLAESRLLLSAIYNPTFGLLQGGQFDHRFQQASILDTGRLDDGLSAAHKSLDLAVSHGSPDLISESRCALAGLKAFGAVRLAAPLVVRKSLSDDEKLQMAKSLDSLDDAAEVLRFEVREWGERVRKRAGWGRLPGRLVDTSIALLLTCDGFRAEAAELGVPDSRPERRLVKVGEWSADDFAKGPDATLNWDITAVVPIWGGVFNVAFDFLWGSAYGTDLKAVRVVEDLAGARKTVSVSTDAMGRLSRYEPHKEALVIIPARKPESRLLIELDCAGLPADAPPDRRTCAGRVSLRRLDSECSR